MSEMITVTIERTTIDQFVMERISPEHVLACAQVAQLGNDADRRDEETTEEWVERMLEYPSVMEALVQAHGTPDNTDVDGYDWTELEVE